MAWLSIDCQWGSCGKGLINGYLAEKRQPSLVVCQFGPNSGHTYVDKRGNKILTKQLPTGGIVAKDSQILIGPGSIINPKILLREMVEFNCGDRVKIHPNAAIVLPEDLETEKRTTKGIASTMQGTGAAVVRKIQRNVKDLATVGQDPLLQEYLITPDDYNAMIDDNLGSMQIESAQGVDLSMNWGVSYPYTTSRDITVESVLNDVGVRARDVDEVVAVYRTLPIRVGNIVEDGEQVGFSGGHYRDQHELTWDEVGAWTGQSLKEMTTVTGRVRRVFTWSWLQFHKTMRVVSPCSIFMNFCNYLPTKEYHEFINEVNEEARAYDSRIVWLGMSPSHHDVKFITKGDSSDKN